MTDACVVDSAQVAKWKATLLEQMRRQPRNNIQLGDLRKDKALAIAVMQLVKEQAPRLVLADFGDSMSLSWAMTLDRLSPETLQTMRQDQLLIDAALIDMLGDNLPDAPGMKPGLPDDGSAE